jgi:hypothetical protein
MGFVHFYKIQKNTYRYEKKGILLTNKICERWRIIPGNTVATTGVEFTARYSNL